jgi:hypothetical protein
VTLREFDNLPFFVTRFHLHCQRTNTIVLQLIMTVQLPLR